MRVDARWRFGPSNFWLVNSERRRIGRGRGENTQQQSGETTVTHRKTARRRVYNKATRPPARGRGESEVESSPGLGAAPQPMNLTPLILFFYFKMAAMLPMGLSLLFRQRLSHRSVKAYATMSDWYYGGEKVWRWLIEVQCVYQQEKRRHRHICLCWFPLGR